MIDDLSNGILIIDFGSQTTQLIARRIRELNVLSAILPCDVDEKKILDTNPRGIILSGGPESAAENGSWTVPPVVFTSQVPILGICYGMHALVLACGGKVKDSKNKEFGKTFIKVTKTNELFETDESLKEIVVWMSHGDKVTRLPSGFYCFSSSLETPIVGIFEPKRKIFGLQFHPEVTHTPLGKKILKRFVSDVCGCIPSWNPSEIIESVTVKIKDQVGTGKVLLGVSGGVDSSVTALLLQKSIGQQLTTIFVDNGLLRKDEPKEVVSMFSNNPRIRFIKIDARKKFLDALKGVTDPEKKRIIIGHLFIEVFENEAKKLDGMNFIGQGTIYPDIVESAASTSGKAHAIKSHHNVGGLPENLGLELVEPLRDLFKDEVRSIGKMLGLPSKILDRHPFPGPGLAVRILGEITEGALDTVREADSIFIDMLEKHGWYKKVSQAFAVYLPLKTVGVVGDRRRYEPVIALRAVETTDFMTAKPARLPHEFIEEVASRIVNTIPTVSRVVYDISSKPPATIEWE